MDERLFEIKPVLDLARKLLGDSKFGYRMQGLFAHVLLRLGATVLEVNAQGHPDVKAELSSRTLLAQVKTAVHYGPRYRFELSEADLDGIRTHNDQAIGYLALLDCAVPVRWALVDSRRAAEFCRGLVHVSVVHVAAEQPISRECTMEFADIVLNNKSRLKDLRFDVLRKRALEGRGL